MMDNNPPQNDQSRFDNPPNEDAPAYLSASEATALLDIKAATLYTYVSRGLVRSVPSPNSRGHLYARSDIERLRTRQRARAGHTAVAADALTWGEPVLDTSISHIHEGALFYREQNILDLIKNNTPFESVASYLWTHDLPPTPTIWPAPFHTSNLTALLSSPTLSIQDLASPLETLTAALPLLACHDLQRCSPDPERELARARNILRNLAPLPFFNDLPEHIPHASSPVALSVALNTQPSDTRRTQAINTALVLCADHELNASTFATRVVASTGADLYACLQAGLSALSGPKHGGACDRIEGLIDEIATPKRAHRVLLAHLKRGESIPGFGHRLYPKGDPRVQPILDAAFQLTPHTRRLETVHALLEAMRQLDHPEPSLDFALVVLCAALDLPHGFPVALFALGRCAGWIAHALEQRASGALIRPRARYKPISVS